MERLTKDQMDLIERFHAAYNDIERCMQEDLKSRGDRGFRSLLDDYAEKHPLWNSAAELKLYAGLRNVLAHDRVKAYGYPCVPLPTTVSQIEEIRDRLLNPSPVIPAFQRPVATVDMQDSLASVLRTIHTDDFSQFPVYAGDQLKGLLTENGITRWLARYVTSELTLVELEETPVSAVFEREEQSNDWRLISRYTAVDDAAGMFVEDPLLEALLISASGRAGEKLIGIITRWDILNVMGEIRK